MTFRYEKQMKELKQEVSISEAINAMKYKKDHKQEIEKIKEDAQLKISQQEKELKIF